MGTNSLALAVVALTALAADGTGAVEERATRLAILPLVDQAGGTAPREFLDGLLAQGLAAGGFDIVAADALHGFLARQRLRYTGGVTSELLQALGAELTADAVLVGSVDLCEPGPPPRLALNARIVAAASGRIVWTDEIARSGDDHPGVLGLGEIHDLGRLAEVAVSRLVDSLTRSGLARAPSVALASGVWRPHAEPGRYRPKKTFRSAELERARSRRPRIAVLPFENHSERADSGDVISGLFATYLAGREGLELIEPGQVRDAMLRGRVIQEQGLSLPQGDVLRELLDADLAVTGRVLEFADFVGAPVPRAALAVWVIDVRRRTLVWSCYSANRGDDGVVFFQHGRVRSARALAGAMVHAAAARLAGDLEPMEER